MNHNACARLWPKSPLANPWKRAHLPGLCLICSPESDSDWPLIETIRAQWNTLALDSARSLVTCWLATLVQVHGHTQACLCDNGSLLTVRPLAQCEPKPSQIQSEKQVDQQRLLYQKVTV